MTTIHLQLGTVAAIITFLEYLLSTLAALSARATLHGVWLLGLHRGGEAALDARARTRRGVRKDFVGFLLTIVLVIAAASVESQLAPAWVLRPYARNLSSCVSVFGAFKQRRVEAHSPPFRVGVEPWVLRAAMQLNCRYGIASVGVGSWIDLKGRKLDMAAPTCVNKSLDLASGAVGVKMKRYKFQGIDFEPVLGESPLFTLFPLRIQYLGKGLKQVGTAMEGQRACGQRGISGYSNSMRAHYETRTIHGRNLSFALHEMVCEAHGSKPIFPIRAENVDECIPNKGGKELDLKCFLDSTTDQQRYSVRLSHMAALYVSEDTGQPAYACVNSTVQVEYVFITADLATRLRPSDNQDTTRRFGPPTLPVLIPTAAKSISGTCERTIAPLAQSALLFSTEQEWRNYEFAPIDRQVRFHAYMMAVSDSLFPLPNLPAPESSRNNGTCYTRPCHEVTEIPMSWASIFMIVWVCLVVAIMVSGLIFRLFFRGESWLVGSARWSLNRLLGDGRGDGEQHQEALIEAVPIPPEPGFENSLQRSPLAFALWTNRNNGPEPRDWKYEFRLRPKADTPKETTQVNAVQPLREPSTSPSECNHVHHDGVRGNDDLRGDRIP